MKEQHPRIVVWQQFLFVGEQAGKYEEMLDEVSSSEFLEIITDVCHHWSLGSTEIFYLCAQVGISNSLCFVCGHSSSVCWLFCRYPTKIVTTNSAILWTFTTFSIVTVMQRVWFVRQISFEKIHNTIWAGFGSECQDISGELLLL
jgi:hypothetical protein